MRAFGVVDVVERIDLGLELFEVAEQGLVEPFVLSLGGRLVWLTGDRLDPQSRDMFHELADSAVSPQETWEPTP